MKEAPKQKLPSTITVISGGEPKEIFMSFNKLNRCHLLMGDIDNVPLVTLSPSLREAIICEMLAEKGKTFKPEDNELDPEDNLRLAGFVAEHLLDFTLGALSRAEALQARNKPALAEIQDRLSSSTATKPGLESSTSPTPAA